MSSSSRVAVRVWGELACWTRPEYKAERVSYELMTPSGARGVLEAIFWEPQMAYLIDHIAVVRRGCWISLRRNEITEVVNVTDVPRWQSGSKPVRYIQAGGGAPDAAQRNMLALADVEYVISAEVVLSPRAEPPRDNVGKYLEEFRRRARRGKCAHRPCLGMREFVANFEGVDPSDGTQAAPWNEDLGLMLYDVFDPGLRQRSERVTPQPVFFHARVGDGVLDCHPDRINLIRSLTKEVS